MIIAAKCRAPAHPQGLTRQMASISRHGVKQRQGKVLTSREMVLEKQTDCFLLAEGFELLFLDVQVHDLNETLCLGLLEHQLPPLLFGAVHLLSNPEKRIIMIRGVFAPPFSEVLDVCWSSPGAVCGRRIVCGYA